MTMGSIGAGDFNFLGLVFRIIAPVSKPTLMNGDGLSKPRMQSNIGYVLQFTHMLEVTIAASVAFGTERGRDFITKGLNIAYFSDRLKSLPKSMASLIDEARKSLSVEQWPSMTEAPYQCPTALVPNEATYAVDRKTQQAFITLLADLLWFSTISFVTKKVKTMHFCECVIFLQADRIIAKGLGFLQLTQMTAQSGTS